MDDAVVRRSTVRRDRGEGPGRNSQASGRLRPASAEGAAAELASRGDRELGVDVAEVEVDGLRSDPEAGRDLAARHALGDERGDLAFPRRQRPDTGGLGSDALVETPEPG